MKDYSVLSQIDITTYMAKVSSIPAFILSSILFAFENIKQQFVVSDASIIATLLVMMVIDLITGVWKSIKLKKFNSYKLGRTVEKFIVYSLACAACVLLRAVETIGAIDSVFEYVALVVYALMCAKEFFSIGENLQEMGYNVMPKWVRERWSKFQEDEERALDEGTQSPLTDLLEKNSGPKAQEVPHGSEGTQSSPPQQTGHIEEE